MAFLCRRLAQAPRGLLVYYRVDIWARPFLILTVDALPRFEEITARRAASLLSSAAPVWYGTMGRTRTEQRGRRGMVALVAWGSLIMSDISCWPQGMVTLPIAASNDGSSFVPGLPAWSLDKNHHRSYLLASVSSSLTCG